MGLSHGKGEGVLVRTEDAHVCNLLDSMDEVRMEKFVRKFFFLSFCRIYRSSDIHVTFVGELFRLTRQAEMSSLSQ